MLKAFKIGYCRVPPKPIHKISNFLDLFESASTAKFIRNKHEITVENYFNKKYNIKLMFPGYRLVWVGSREKKEYFPIEFCLVFSNHASMKRNEINSNRKEKLEQLINKPDISLHSFGEGLGFTFNKSLAVIDGHTIKPSELEYHRGKTVIPSNGIWNNSQFIKACLGGDEIKWCILKSIDHQNVKSYEVAQFKDDLVTAAKRMHINLKKISATEIFVKDLNSNSVIRNFLQQLVAHEYKFALVIVDNKIYNNVKAGGKYKADYCHQEPNKEIIDNLYDAFINHLNAFNEENHQLPERIFYCRDGISNSQYNDVKNIEIEALIKATKKIYKNLQSPEIIVFVALKRHHSRFFVDTESKNIPGSVIDTDIVEKQFLLLSHLSIQNVARPTKYEILLNDSKLNNAEIEQKIFDLCHGSARINKSSSYPLPIFYAHLSASRAKTYSLGEDDQMGKLPQIDGKWRPLKYI